jgi:hypothetical protein
MTTTFKNTCLYGDDDTQKQIQFGLPAAIFVTAKTNIRIKTTIQEIFFLHFFLNGVVF